MSWKPGVTDSRRRRAATPAETPEVFSARLEQSRNRLWGAHLRVPAAIARRLITGTTRRVVRTLNGSAEHQCALLLHGAGSFVVAINKQWRDRLRLAPGALVTVTLRRDRSRYGLPFPVELEELLRQDPEGGRVFHALTPGKQRTLLHIIGSVKSPDGRAWRAATIVRHLRANAGGVNYKRLARDLKRPGSPSARRRSGDAGAD